ncbi:helix-turn-helix domain-containing protein (plasmid) [Clostridium estertheticum]|uniref:DNA (cytosine-5-)-methyltransferase n=1 Tax=Clostridium estertheticum TaxID=238834 RepID=UPI001C7D9B15|nr:DNA (cytosine-5-)-methyltransferase [Clostridium estertheticum]MBX4262867.1 helix-turn-helix domain-containing protein [Clostridium estertheticum]WLC73225.1 helix-turn-helix domain-containing protein [Clostridium estertheticum]
MTTVKLKIAELRKDKGIGQQELSKVLGVSFQSVSKWETGVAMPDITLLPSIAEYFNVSVDELLGLKPLRQQVYIPRNTDNRENWNGKIDKMDQRRKYFWNDDYLKFLVKNVWNIELPIDVIDFRCGNGYLGMKLLELLPKGSTYTGVDNEYFTSEGKLNFDNTEFNAKFIVSDTYSLEMDKKYDMAICQVGLRHMNKPMDALTKMVDSVKKSGLVVCVDVNREFENDGLYIDDISYNYLCTAFDFHKLWKKELEFESRDYAIGMRLPFYMQQLGLNDIDIRMDDKVMYVNSDMQDYEEKLQDFIEINGWDKSINSSSRENLIETFMNRGIDRVDAEAYIEMQSKIAGYFRNTANRKSFLKVQGLLITYGRK